MGLLEHLLVGASFSQAGHSFIHLLARLCYYDRNCTTRMTVVEHYDVAVVGGGIIGLSCAYELAAKGFKVAVIESSSDAGGLARTIELSNGIKCEAFYHHFFMQDIELSAYIDALLQDSLVYKQTTMSIFQGGMYHSWNGLVDLLFSRIIGLRDKLRFVVSTILLSSGSLPANFLANKSLTEGMEILYGRRAYEKIWGPMIYGKFGSEAANTALEWMAGRLSQRLSSRSRGAEYLGFLPGSISRLTQAMSSYIRAKDCKLYLNSLAVSVRKVDISVNKCYDISMQNRLNPEGPESIHADQIVFTISSSKVDNILASLDGYDGNWQKDKYYRAICVLLELRESISDFYWNNIADPACFFTGYIEQTQLTGREEYGGLVIGYLTKYLAPSDPSYDLSIYDLKKLALSDLQIIAPQFKMENLIKLNVSIAEDAQVITPIGYRPNEESISALPGIKLVNISMTYPEERGINNAIKLGKHAAKLAENA